MFNAAILLTAFGASSAEARRAYEPIDAAVRACWPGREVRWAFTSRRILARLRAEGVAIDAIDEAVARLKRDGFDKVVVLPLLTVAGEEHAKITRHIFEGLKAHICRPLLSAEADIDEVCRALSAGIRPDAVNVLVCHGNNTYDAYNDLLVTLGDAFRVQHNGFAASVEGRPGTGCFPAVAEIAKKTGRVHFAPFMIVAGDHIQNDVMGNKPDSWKVQIGAPQTTCAPSLGFNREIVKLYMQRLREGMQQMESEEGNGC